VRPVLGLELEERMQERLEIPLEGIVAGQDQSLLLAESALKAPEGVGQVWYICHVPCDTWLFFSVLRDGRPYYYYDDDDDDDDYYCYYYYYYYYYYCYYYYDDDDDYFSAQGW